MKKLISIRSVLALAFVLGIIPASAEPVLFEGNGHYYEIVADPGIDWNAADAEANSREFAGTFGHLATITSKAEDDFIEALRANADLSRPEVWVGGRQYPHPCTPEPTCNWMWVNGEGAIPIANALVPYANWLPNTSSVSGFEPNDNTGAGSENHLAIGLGGMQGWNDEGALGNIGGFVVEYDTIETLSGSQCNPACSYNGVQYQVEIEPTETITFQSFLIEDNDATCGIEPRNFTLPTVSGAINTTMAKYLCGVKNPETETREFVAVVVSKSFESLQAADVETDPSVYFDFSLTCNNPLLDQNPLEQDIAHFATDIIGDMPRGHSSDATYDCGSSRGKVKGTILFIGTQYVFNDGVELNWNNTPDAVTLAFIGVTRDRLQDLIRAINDAKPGVPKKQLVRWLLMRVAAELAIWTHDRGNYKIARKTVNAVNQLFAKASFNSNAGTAPAFIDIWGSHLLFMYDVKVIPYAP